MTTRALVEAAYHAVQYDGHRLDLDLLTAEERAVWDDVAATDQRRQALVSECRFEEADALH